MGPFTHDQLPSHVTFGPGAVARAAEALDRLGVRRAILLTTPAQVEQAATALAPATDRIAARFGDATMHTPVEVTEAALAVVVNNTCDGVLAFGGGSTIGLGKAIALRTDLPQLVVPTTYAGSEMTPILGETREGRKTTIRSAKVQPEAVIYDPDLTLGLPPTMSGTSGLNAMAHAVEGLYAPDASPIVQLMAEEGVRALAKALPAVIDDGEDRDARSDALYGAWLCGAVLGTAGMSLHHKLCHTLGGSFDLPHAEVHSVVLPYALAFNAAAVPDAIAALRRAFGADDPVAALWALGRRLKAPASLREIGLAEADIDEAARQACQAAYWNPRPITYEGLRPLLESAWRGEPPRAAWA